MDYIFLTYRKPDITEGLKSLRCRTLIFVGDSSPFHSEALHMASKLDRRYSALVEVCCNSCLTPLLAIIHVCVGVHDRYDCAEMGITFLMFMDGFGCWWCRSSLVDRW